MNEGFRLDEFLQGAMMNCPITLVTGGVNNPKKIETCVNEIDTKEYEGKTFTCWDIQNGKLVIYIDD